MLVAYWTSQCLVFGIMLVCTAKEICIRIFVITMYQCFLTKLTQPAWSQICWWNCSGILLGSYISVSIFKEFRPLFVLWFLLLLSLLWLFAMISVRRKLTAKWCCYICNLKNSFQIFCSIFQTSFTFQWEFWRFFAINVYKNGFSVCISLW